MTTPDETEKIVPGGRYAGAADGPYEWDGDVCNVTPEFRDQEAPWLTGAKGIEVLGGHIRCHSQGTANLLADSWKNALRVAELEEGLTDLAAWIARRLDSLEYRQTGTGPAFNGFSFSAVPEWELKQKFDDARALLAGRKEGE